MDQLDFAAADSLQSSYVMWVLDREEASSFEQTPIEWVQTNRLWGPRPAGDGV